VIDLVLLALIGISALLGVLKGFVRTVVGTVSWFLAGWAAFRFGGDVVIWLAEGGLPSTGQYLSGYILTFVGVLVAVWLAGKVLKGLIEAVRLDGLDRLLGFALGVVRGALASAALVMLMSFTPMPREHAWSESHVVPVLLPVAELMRALLPDISMPEMDLGKLPSLDMGKLPAAGDNAALNDMMMGSGLQKVVSGALGASQRKDAGDGNQQDPARVLPSNIDPAQVRPDHTDPARVESQGQTRPPSR
jgi:membrane protein required for colicin V production